MRIRNIESRTVLTAISLACAGGVAVFGASPMLDAILRAAGGSALPPALDHASPIAAAGFFVAGFCTLFPQRGSVTAPLAGGATVILLGLALLSNLEFGDADAGRLSAQAGHAMTAICLLLAGSAILSRGIDRWFGGDASILSVTLQAALLGAAILALLTGLAEVPPKGVWGQVTHLPLSYAVAFAGLGLGMTAGSSAIPENRQGLAHGLPITVFIAAVAVTLSIWLILDADKHGGRDSVAAPTGDLSDEALLLFGLVMSASLAAAIAAAQRARAAAADALANAARFRHAERIAGLFHWSTGSSILDWEYASDYAETFYGVPLDEFVANRSRFASIIYRGDRMRVLAQYESLDRNPRPYVLEYRFVHPDSGVRFCREVGEPIFDGRGKLLHFRGTTQDITQKRATEAKLMEAKADAEDANRAKSEFLAHMSHELRTPLNSIIGFSQIISNHVFGVIGNAKYEEYIGVIERSAQHLLSLINDVLDLSKVEAGRIELAEAPLDVTALSREAVELVFGTANSRRIVYKIAPAVQARMLLGDRRLILQCLTNLLGNARKFTPVDGTVTVDLSLARDTGFRIAVADTGIGIAEDKLEQVLEPFSQIRPDVEHSAEGTGLGLAIVKRLVELHGGEIAIESTLGDGTTVTLFFPQNRTIPADCTEMRAATA